jgi:hypothetical protein
MAKTDDSESRTHGETCLGAAIQLVGQDAAFRLVEAFGGSRLYVPETPRPGNKIAAIIGDEATAALARVLGGECIKLPVARDWRVITHRNEGLSYANIARKLSIDESSVHRILRKLGATLPRAPLAPEKSVPERPR